MSAIEWPKQNTWTFAVPTCVQCCTMTVVDKYEVRVDVLPEYHISGIAGFDGASYTLYKTVTWGGGFDTQYSNDGCETFEASSNTSYSGSSTINYGYDLYGPDGTSGTLTMTTDGSVTGESNAINPDLQSPIGAGTISGTSTATTETMSGDETCTPIGGTFSQAKTSGTATATLSNPATEDGGLAWRDANYPGRGDWFEVSKTDRLWSSTFEPLHGSFSGVAAATFMHMTVEYRITKGGYNPGSSYNCSIKLYRASWDTDDWSEYATVEDTIVASPEGNLIFTGTAPLARGYRTFPDASSFTATPA